MPAVEGLPTQSQLYLLPHYENSVWQTTNNAVRTGYWRNHTCVLIVYYALTHWSVGPLFVCCSPQERHSSERSSIIDEIKSFIILKTVKGCVGYQWCVNDYAPQFLLRAFWQWPWTLTQCLFFYRKWIFFLYEKELCWLM